MGFVLLFPNKCDCFGGGFVLQRVWIFFFSFLRVNLQSSACGVEQKARGDKKLVIEGECSSRKDAA